MPEQQSTQPELNRPYQPQLQLPQRVDYAQSGLSAGLTVVVGTVVAGAVALAAGKKQFYDKMFRTRMVVVVRGFCLCLL